MRPLVYFGEAPDGQTAEQARVCQETGPVHGMALMADNHLGYAVPIGGVIAYRDAISPSGVGFDIGCGVKAVKTNLAAAALADRSTLNDALDEIQGSIEFGVGRPNEVIIDHPVMDSSLWDEVPREIGTLKQQASRQLGTVGAGNHYVDILIEEDSADGIGRESPVWVACHFGSRGLGHKTATYFLKKLGARDEIMAAPAVIDSAHAEFAQYLTAMQLAGEYAYAGRDIVIDQVLEILGAETLDEIHNHHNFAWPEVHDGEPLMVVRKVRRPLGPGSAASSAAAWATSRPSSRARMLPRRSRHTTRPCMARAGSTPARGRKASATARPAKSLLRATSAPSRCTRRCATSAVSSSAEATSTSPRSSTASSTGCSQPRVTRSSSATACARSVWSWPAPTPLTHSRTEADADRDRPCQRFEISRLHCPSCSTWASARPCVPSTRTSSVGLERRLARAKSTRLSSSSSQAKGRSPT